MKKILIITLILFVSFLNAQNKIEKNYTFGDITNDEFNLKTYPLDTTANAVVLFESGSTVFKVEERIIIETQYYHKIKILKKEGFDQATFEIPLYNNGYTKEEVVDIKAVTTNDLSKNTLSKSQIFTEKDDDHWKTVKFTLPNIKIGSIIEVEYTVKSPFKFNLTGWEFQSDIPKKLSIYRASIPGNYIYNRKLTGYVKLKTNTSTIKRKCFRVPAFTDANADCENLEYAAENIPAFIEEEYMTAAENFKSKIKFELAEFKWFDRTGEKFSKSWDDVDKEFRTDKDIGSQLRKNSFFEDKIPAEIKALPNTLEKAKKIYYFIQNHFSWNNKNSLFNDVRVKKAFEEQTGSVSEINISLINALKSAGFKTELVAISTRKNGFPTKKYPVITDFNYSIAKLNIEDKFYLLDATEKELPFNLLPYRCLNGIGRVMDFKNSSYWIDIKPNKVNKTAYTAAIELKEDGTFIGKLRRYYSGYDAYFKRNDIQNLSEDDIISKFEDNYTDLEVVNYSISNKNDKEKPLIEVFEIEIENLDATANNLFNPFFDNKFNENPFKQENRLYPVDFGYKRSYSTNFTLELPDNYELKSFPKNKSLALPEKAGSFSIQNRKPSDYKYMLKSTFKLNKPIYYNYEYAYLKELFSQMIKSQKTPLIIVKKTLEN